MMGKTHALTGLFGGLLGAYMARVGIGEGAAGVMLCAGAAILPDIDHPRSTISNAYGPLTRSFCWIMSKLTGGHRRGTHSLPGIAVLGLVAQGGVTYRHTIPGMVALSVIMILCLAGAVRLLKIPGWIDDLLPIPIVVGVVCFTSLPLDLVPVSVMLGCVIHVAGDMVTKTGCPLLWPFSQTNTKLGLFKTNGVTERYVVTPLTIVATIGLLVWMFYSGVDWGNIRM